ncbi:MAG TPA: class I SAM-dependent methyltransferase [Nitrospiraceae bacterium]|nr:class I SAM-dependent methyltransferase [Nitrospiraceae bacterium]
MTDPTYALGRSDDEHARLTEQANFLRPLTERLFKKAGIVPGMKVLDVGSGVGDVAFLLAELVGRDGKIVGVDMDGAALEKARKRAEQLKLRNVEFVHGDIRTTALSGPFDAAVGRLVLLYCADPVAALAHIATQVRASGIVAFQEMEMNSIAALATYGDSLLGKVVETVCRTFAAAGVRVHMASELRHTFVKAGLGEPELLGEFVVGGGSDFAGYSWLANTMRSLAPMARKLGILLEPLGDLDTLAQRLRSEAANERRDFWSPPYVGAFVRIAS